MHVIVDFSQWTSYSFHFASLHFVLRVRIFQFVERSKLFDISLKHSGYLKKMQHLGLIAAHQMHRNRYSSAMMILMFHLLQFFEGFLLLSYAAQNLFRIFVRPKLFLDEQWKKKLNRKKSFFDCLILCFVIWTKHGKTFSFRIPKKRKEKTTIFIKFISNCLKVLCT